MSNQLTEEKKHLHDYTRTLVTYSIGFITSIVLTIAAYALVMNQIFSGTTILFIIIGLAIAQFAVQLIFFLHLPDEARPRWKLVSFLFMLAILCVIVLGSLWIMFNLNGRMMMSTEEMNQYMIDQQGF